MKFTFYLGDKVIKSNGLSGYITMIKPKGNDTELTISYEGKKTETILAPTTDTTDNYKNFYLIGQMFLGNKDDEKYLVESIGELKVRISVLAEELNKKRIMEKLYRKQLRRLRKEMTPEYHEKLTQHRKNETVNATLNAQTDKT